MSAQLRWAIVAVIIILNVYYFIAMFTKPDCPEGSSPKLTRSGWYCTVPAVRGFRG